MTTPLPNASDTLDAQLDYLKLPFIRAQYRDLAQHAAEQHWDHMTFLAQLIEGDTQRRQDRAVQRRIRLAHFPVLKTLDQFDWSWPKKINRLQVQNLFRLPFLAEHANVIFIGSVGLGKSHLCIALGLTACQNGHRVMFASAIDVINTLAAAQSTGRLKQALRTYLQPRVLILDELGYLPVDKVGADLLFQVISQRYERATTIISTNRVYKKWAEIFNNDATITAAVLDRLLHHAETITIEGKSFRMKEQIEEP